MPLLAFAALLGSLTPIDALKEVRLGDGEHLTADQALSVADDQYLGEQLGNIVADGTNKIGNGGEVRDLIAGQGDEGDVVAAGAFDLAAADDALRIGEQDDLEQDGGRVAQAPAPALSLR